MHPRHRDALLAVAALCLLLGVSALAGTVGSLTDWRAALVGGVGSLLLEALFVRYPDRSRNLWERPVVQAIGFALVAGVGIAAIRSGLGPVVAALTWGLVTYLLLLGVVVGGYRNPVGVLVGRG